MRLLNATRDMHRRGKFPGCWSKDVRKRIEALIEQFDAKTILDYGSGRGKQYKRVDWREKVTMYDPAVAGRDVKPTGQFDGVLCTDVMEHIPEEEVDEAIGDLFRYARKFMFVRIATRPARKHFPDGTNVHVTVRPKPWWLDRFARYKTDASVHIEWEE